MSNTFKKTKPISPEIKTNASKTIPQKQTLKSLNYGKNIKLSEGNFGRGHDMTPKSRKIHNQSSDSDKLSEEDLKQRTSRLRTMKLQPITDKKVLMDKFECSLKERLLSSAHFSRQVPLYDSISKDKIRMKTPSLDEEDLSKNESVYNAVFPVRKDAGKGMSPQFNEDIFSQYTKESQDWLNEIEKQVQKDTAAPDEGLLTKSTKVIKQHKKGSDGSKNQEKLVQNIDNEPLEQMEVLSSSRLPSKIRTRGSKRTKILKEKSSAPELESNKSQISTLPKLPKKTDSDSKKNMTLENQKSDRSDKINSHETDNSNLSEMLSKLDEDNTKQTNDQISGNRDHETKMIDSKVLPDEKLNDSFSSTNISSNYNLDIVFVEKDISEKESIHIYGQGRTDDHKKRALSSFKESSQSTSLNTDASLSTFNKGSRQGGALGGTDSLMHYDEYNVLYFQVDENSMEKKKDLSEETTAETKETLPEPSPKDFSQVSAIDDKISQDNKSSETDDEEPSQKDEQDEEEDCTAEPCNEPVWFEEYGIDRKNRKGTEEDAKSEESSEDALGEVIVLKEADTVKEVVKDEDVQESKKKKVKKTQITDTKEFEEGLEVMEEIQEFKSEVLREIKTIPLVTFDEMPEKEMPVVAIEKPKEETTPMKKTGAPIDYLKKYIGKHLVAGLAQVALLMPRDPVEYLAQWLIKERNKENLLDELKEFKSEVRHIRKQNINEMRRKLQIDFLQNEAIKRYNEEALNRAYDSSESDDFKANEEAAVNKLKEDILYMPEQEEIDDAI